MKGTTEEKDTRGTLAKARDALLETLNLKSRADDDEEEDDDEGAPSEEDRVKAAAPKEAPPKQDDDQDGDTDDDDESDGDDDEDGEGDDAEQRAPAPAAAPAQAQVPPQQAPQQVAPQQQAPPVQRGKKKPMPPMRKSLEEIENDDLMAEIQRRIADPDTPEIMKSLAALPNAPEIFEAIDMSPAVASIVQLAAEQMMAKDVIISELTKSHADIAEGNNEIVQSIEVVLRALPKMIAQNDAIQKSLSEIGDDVALVKSQDNGKVSHGTRPVIVKSRVDPKTASEETDEDDEKAALPEGLNSGRLTRGLMKAMSPTGGGLIGEVQAMDLIGKINGQTGMVGVWSQLSEPVREVVLATR